MTTMTIVSLFTTILFMLLKGSADLWFKDCFPEALLMFTPVFETLYDLSLTLFAVFFGWSISKAYDEQRKFKLAVRQLVDAINVIVGYKYSKMADRDFDETKARAEISKSVSDLFFHGYYISTTDAKSGTYSEIAKYAAELSEMVKPHYSKTLDNRFPEDFKSNAFLEFGSELFAKRQDLEKLSPTWAECMRHELKHTEHKPEIKVPIQTKQNDS